MKFGPWTLSKSEEARLKAYEKLQDLTSSKAANHDPLYKRDVQEAGTGIKPAHLWLNMPGLVCRAAADLILPRVPVIRVKDEDEALQSRVDALMRRSKLRTLAWRSIYWTCAQGDTFLVVSDVEDAAGGKQPVISQRRATGTVARNIRVEDSPASRQFLFLSNVGGVELFTEHKAGEMKHYAFSGDKVAQLPKGYAPSVPTKEQVPLVVHLAALRGDDSDEAFGESDFDGTEDLSFEVSNRLRHVGKILDKHSEPPMNIPDGVLDESGMMDPRKKKVFERGVDGAGAEYITWTSQLAEAYTEIDKITDLILLLTETPPALWGRDKTGGAESGRALKFRLLSGMGKARRTGGAFIEAIIEATNLALRREDLLAGNTAAEYSDLLECQLAETFIADEIEKVEQIAKLRQSQAISVRRAVELGQDLSGPELDEEVELIEGEQSAPQLGFEPGRV